MLARDVIESLSALARAGVDVWIDGGWAVDAVLGRQTRPHADLDIAVEDRAVAALRAALAQQGFSETPSRDASRWTFVVAAEDGRRIDVHVVVLDERDGVFGEPLDGIAYPAGSLTGEGIIAGMPVRCVAAEAMLRFKTSYPPRAIDRADVAALCKLLGRAIPDTHR